VREILDLRNGYPRLIAEELKLEMDGMSNCEFERLLRLLTETADEVNVISDTIIHHKGVVDMAIELVQSKKYSFEFELNLFRLE